MVSKGGPESVGLQECSPRAGLSSEPTPSGDGASTSIPQLRVWFSTEGAERRVHGTDQDDGGDAPAGGRGI